MYILNKMSVKQLCALHQAEAVSQCLYHLEPMCDECKYDDQHKDCPKDTLKVNDKIPESGKELYNQCQHIYYTGVEICNANSSHFDKPAKELAMILSNICKDFKSKADLLQEDLTNCVDETNSLCKQQTMNAQNDVQRMLRDVGTLMKEFIEGKGNLSRVKQRAEQFQKMVDVKNNDTRNCDFKSLLTEKLACLLHPERLTLPQAVLSSKLMECLYPPVLNPKLELRQELNTKPLFPSDKMPVITGCIILRTGSLVLVDKANCNLKLFQDNGIEQEMKLAKEPFDVTEKNGGLCVSFPNACIIALIKNPGNNGEEKVIINTQKKCYGVEYGGGKLVVACYSYELLRLGSKWMFHVYGINNKLLRVIEKDRLGHPFDLSNGCFDFCPFRDEILFMRNDGTAAMFNLTGPSLLESLGDMGSRNGETLTAIRSSGNMKVTCHTENYFRIPYHQIFMGKSTLRIHDSSSFIPNEITFSGRCAGSIYFDVRSRKLVVCEEDKSDTCYVYSI